MYTKIKDKKRTLLNVSISFSETKIKRSNYWREDNKLVKQDTFNFEHSLKYFKVINTTLVHVQYLFIRRAWRFDLGINNCLRKLDQLDRFYQEIDVFVSKKHILLNFQFNIGECCYNYYPC
jgi:hypothetical protein